MRINLTFNVTLNALSFIYKTNVQKGLIAVENRWYCAFDIPALKTAFLICSNYDIVNYTWLLKFLFEVLDGLDY